MIKKIIKKSLTIYAIFKRLRLLYLMNFNQGYISKKLKTRKGHCKKCGKCCGDCAFLLPPNKKGERICEVYKDRPSFCFPKDAPLEERHRTPGCGYYWDKK